MFIPEVLLTILGVRRHNVRLMTRRGGLGGVGNLIFHLDINISGCVSGRWWNIVLENRGWMAAQRRGWGP